jgi:hypothetical protein
MNGNKVFVYSMNTKKDLKIIQELIDQCVIID